MPFIPHTEQNIKDMLDTIGVASIDDLFDEIPAELRDVQLNKVPEGIGEMQISRIMRNRSQQDGNPACFIGAGAYEHHIPAAVWELTTRGEFYTAYTPYQAEASQGTLQLLYEFQTMMANLTGMDVSNASLYDGASALAEAVLMAVRANKKSKSKRILIPSTVHPAYRRVAYNIIHNQGIVLETLDFDSKTGCVDPQSLPDSPDEFAALVIPQPNFFGSLEDVDALTNWAHSHKALVIAVVNPISLALLKPPGEWGDVGADISCGEGQPLGAPLSSGGPYFGFMCCKQQHVRQMPGRIIGRTVDLDGKPGFALTLQAREQHIRRSKATSNICTNQGLLTTAATIFMSLLGPQGLSNVATQCHNNSRNLLDKIKQIKGVDVVFEHPFFHEIVVRLPQHIDKFCENMTARNIISGYSLQQDYPQLENCLLICVTETKTDEDINDYVEAMRESLEQI